MDDLERICRLQNWAETGDTTTKPGKEYSSNALIDTTAFDASTMGQARSRFISYQIHDEKKGHTNNLKDTICRQIWCSSFVNESGQESVAYLPRVESSPPSDTITLDDVPYDMEIGEVQEPDHSRVFCEPFVRYNYDYGREKYNGYIGLRNVSLATFDSSYATGLGDAENEYFWNRCHDELWTKFRFVQDPPASLTDLPHFYRYEDAVWYLDNWITWMQLRSISVPVYYDLAKSWHIGRHVYLQLPHQTNGELIECVIDKITKNHIENACEINLIMLENVDTPSTSYYIQDTMDENNTEWTDTMTQYGNDQDKVDNT